MCVVVVVVVVYSMYLREKDRNFSQSISLRMYRYLDDVMMMSLLMMSLLQNTVKEIHTEGLVHDAIIEDIGMTSLRLSMMSSPFFLPFLSSLSLSLPPSLSLSVCVCVCVCVCV